MLVGPLIIRPAKNEFSSLAGLIQSRRTLEVVGNSAGGTNDLESGFSPASVAAQPLVILKLSTNLLLYNKNFNQLEFRSKFSSCSSDFVGSLFWQ